MLPEQPMCSNTAITADDAMTGLDVSTATVIIVDDERDTRDAMEMLITSADYRCVSFASGEAFLEQPLPPVPCCVLLDLQLGGQSGLEVQNELNARQVGIPVVFVSGDDSIARAVSTMRAGAIDFLQKPCAPELLLKRVERALELSVDGYGRKTSAEHDAALLAGLTPREHEILALLVDGHINKEVGQLLDISTRTVETHRMHIMDKLKARTLADLVRVWLNGARADRAAEQDWALHETERERNR